MKENGVDPASLGFVRAMVERGILLEPWATTPALTIFQRSTIHGCADLREPLFRVVAIQNDVPGNGEFGAIITSFEEVAALSGRRFEIVQIWNKPLSRWFRRRGYKITRNSNLGLHAIYRHAAAA